MLSQQPIYLQALSEVDNPTDAVHALDRITTRKQITPKRSAKAFNPVARDETLICRAAAQRRALYPRVLQSRHPQEAG